MIAQIRQFVIPAALALLPPAMDSPQARALLLAIGLQESRFRHRRQIGGPARGFWQFERAGVHGIATHSRSRAHLAHVLMALHYDLTLENIAEIHAALEHNDVLACACARLLLWTLPGALPGLGDTEAGWQTYLAGWRPGKPHRHTWDAFYAEPWQV